MVADYATHRRFVILNSHRFVNELSRAQRQRAALVIFALRGREDDDWRLLRTEFQYGIARQLWKTQIENDEIWLEIPLAQDLERLFTIPGDVQMNQHRRFCEGLSYK